MLRERLRERLQCVTIRTSRKVAGDIKKAAKEAKCSEWRPTDSSQTNNLSKIRTREVQKEGSKFQTKTNSLTAASRPTTESVAQTPDPHPEAEINPKLVNIRESVHKTGTLAWDGNYDRENNYYTNALRPRRFKWCDFSTNL